MCDSPLPQNGGSNCIEDNSHVSIINEIGGMKEIASQTCIVENCPGTNGLELGTFGFLFLCNYLHRHQYKIKILSSF